MTPRWRREILFTVIVLALATVVILVTGQTPRRLAYESERDRACEALQSKQRALREQFDLSKHGRFDWSQDQGVIVFSTNGVPKVAATIQFVGRYSTISKTWLWAWANDTVVPRMSVDSGGVRKFGRNHGFERLTSAKWPADEQDGWDMAALQAQLTAADGAYRTKTDTGYTYLTLKNVHWVKAGEHFSFLPAG